jgi:hypothetical protein
MSGLRTASLLLAMCSLSVNADEESPDEQESLFEVSPETTVADGPFTPQGTVDYIAYLNQRYSEGVTAENNSAVLLCEAFGPGVFDSDLCETYFTRLGIDAPPDEGDYFIGREEFVRQTRASETVLRDALESAIEQPWTAGDYPRTRGLDRREHRAAGNHRAGLSTISILFAAGLRRRSRCRRGHDSGVRGFH